MRTFIKAAVVTAATAVLLVPAASAMAASATINDGTQDTWLVTWDDLGNQTATKSDVTQNVDVRKTVIRFGKRVTVKQKFGSLGKDGVNFMPGALLKTNKGAPVYMQGLAHNEGGTWHHGGYLITGPQYGR